MIDHDTQLNLLKELSVVIHGDDAARILATADEVLKNDPKCDLGLFAAAVAHMRLGNDGVALQLFNVCAQLKPDVHAVWHNMARCLNERHPGEAMKALQKAQAIQPDDADTLVALCNASSALGRHAEALDWWEQHKKLHGFDKNGAVNASFALFHLGRWKEAWALFRGSLGSKDRQTRNYHAGRETPRWRPDKHEDAVVVLYGEQGIGDEIMYASMVPLAVKAAEEKNSRLIIECDERNAGLFRRSFAPLGVTVYGTRAKALYADDWQADERVTHKLEFGGLGEFFAPEPFRASAYLTADPIRREMWRVWLDRSGRAGPKVGIAWTGGSWATGRARRSIPFAKIALLMQEFAQEVDFVCLEYEDRRDDLDMIDAPVLNPHWATRKGADYDELAALVSELDLVIAPTTSVVDLCGALGVPCWAMVDENPQWRYSDFAGHDRMFFYESVKTIRQQEWGRWEPALQVLQEDLRAWLDQNWRSINGAAAAVVGLAQ